MKLLRPTLALTRLRIFSRGTTVYDESFHYGLNIIRGDNGGGKSSIADFIFYVLGGNAKGFKPEALECDWVEAELEFNENPVVIRRLVEVQGRAGFLFFWGRIEDAQKAGVEHWRQYSNARTSNQESYSQILFRELGIPEVKEDAGANVTFYQLLRLLYVDQLSSLQSLLRDEDNFDTAPMRSAVYDVLTGIYEDGLYSDIYALRTAERQQAEARAQAAGIQKFLQQSKIISDTSTLEKAQLNIQKSLNEIEAKIQKYIGAQSKLPKSASSSTLDGIRASLSKIKREYDDASQVQNQAELELNESKLFVEELKKRLQEIDDAIAMHTIFGELPLSHCPCCLSAITPPEDKEKCPLCTQPLSQSARHSHIMRMKHDLAQQLKESIELLSEKEEHLQDSHIRVIQVRALLDTKQQELNLAIEESRSQRESIIDSLFTEKGRALAELEHLARQSQIIATLESLSGRLAELSLLVSNLQSRIVSTQKEQAAKRNIAALKIEELALKLLSSDQVREPAFGLAKRVEIDPAKNTFALDGRNNFSASSIVYLKNCIHYAIFFASLELDFFRYPRFIICDNMEDKGMQLERSRNLQRKVAELSDAAKTKHQIIFTTSMIDPTLDIPKYCIGPYYKHGEWSLKLPSTKPLAGN